jgi:hypothetical protein
LPVGFALSFLSENWPYLMNTQDKPFRAKSLVIQFVVVFLAVVLAGASLMICWHFFSRQTQAPQSSTPETHAIAGQIFIVTQGGQSIKLGLVKIDLLPLQPVMSHLAEKKSAEQSVAAQLDARLETAKADEKAKDAILEDAKKYDISSKDGYAAYSKAYNEHLSAEYLTEDLEEKQLHFPSGSYYFDGLPQPLAETQSDADGEFTIDIPAEGEFALAAHTQRDVGSHVENYFWLIKVQGNGQTKIMLSNDNLFSPNTLLQN